MTNREKLIKLIHHCTSCEECHDSDIADHLIANGVTVQNWRDAKTDPPKEWKGADEYLINYMVYCPEFGVDVGNYVESAQRWVVMGLPVPVTHWQPLPEPPKEE